MLLATAFLLGLAGSLHCAGMCGPLVLALPAASRPGTARIPGPLLYNLGRILTYGLLGIVFGLLGQSLVLIGVQRWLSLGAGIAILLGLFLSSRNPLRIDVARHLAPLRSAMGRTLKHRTRTSLFLFGILNGFLPCGLVYVACTGAVATGDLLSGMGYMILFGLGTLPMMLGLALTGTRLQTLIRFRFQKWIPAAVLCTALLLIVRGLALGIPYLSPDLAHLTQTPCH